MNKAVIFSPASLYLEVVHDQLVVLPDVLVQLGFVVSSGISLDGFWLVQVHVGHVVLVVCWVVVVLGFSVQVGHVVAFVLDVVIGVVGRGAPSAASL